MTEPVIVGVSYRRLRVIEDDRGAVLHFFRSDSPDFTTFGEVYFSEVLPGAVKGWRRHRRQTQRYVVPTGRVRVALYDDRDDSPTRGTRHAYELGRPDSYALLTIPPLIWYAFGTLGDRAALVANCADIPHDPTESESTPIDRGPIDYVW